MTKVFIIAEAGVNHNGELEIAKRLVDVAAEAKADAIKFQTFKAENLVCKYAKKAKYQIEATGNAESQYEMIKKLELNYEEHCILANYCKEKNIKFLSTPFDLESIDLLDELGVDVLKIPSGEITNYPYLVKIAETKKKIILSTGMSTLHEVKAALTVLKKHGAKDIILLHCNTEYPTPYEDVNLNAMITLKNTCEVEVGYSDHTEGIEVAVAAVAMGATVIEKHFTLDRNMEGPDHKASIEPDELIQMIKSIRNIEKALGEFEKKPSPSEIKNMNIARKSITAACKIEQGEIFTENNITTKRPGEGISPMKWTEVVGKKAIRDFEMDEMIEL